MQRELGFSAAELTGAFSLALLVAGVAGIGVGRYLDRHSPRVLMTAGSVAGALLVLAWSRVEGLAAFYALWVAIGLVMAAVLYEPAFTVLAKWFADAGERTAGDDRADARRRASSSFIFLPLGQALIDAHGWRDALVILAVVLAAVTVPLHAVVLRRGPGATREPGAPRRRRGRALGAVLAAGGGVLPRLGGRLRDDRAGDPVPARARSRRVVRRLRGRADGRVADPRPASCSGSSALARCPGRVRARRGRDRGDRQRATAPSPCWPGWSCSGWAAAWRSSPARP